MKYALDEDCWYREIWNDVRDEKYVLSDRTLRIVPTEGIEETKDCISILNEFVFKGKWKRTCKRVCGNMYRPTTYRSFRDSLSGKAVTIYQEEDRAIILDFDLSQQKESISKIVEFCKHYVCPDSGTIYYNPKTKSVFLELPDSFPFWVEDPSDTKKLKEEIERYDCGVDENSESWVDNPNKTLDGVFPDIVRECLYGDEFGPEPHFGYIEIGQIKATDFY